MKDGDPDKRVSVLNSALIMVPATPAAEVPGRSHSLTEKTKIMDSAYSSEWPKVAGAVIEAINSILYEAILALNDMFGKNPIETVRALERGGILLRLDELAILSEQIIETRARLQPGGTGFTARLLGMTDGMTNGIDDHSTSHGKVRQLVELRVCRGDEA